MPVVNEIYADPKRPMARYTDMVYMNGVSLKQVANKASVEPGTFYVDKANNKLYIGNNPAGKMVEATALKQGFALWQNQYSKPAGTTIRGLGFAHYSDRALQVGAPNITLENNTFSWNGFTGVHLAGSTGSNVGSNNAVVRGNTFSYNGCLGLGGHADGLLLENNTISWNNVEHFRKTWNAAGAKFIRTNEVVVRNNIVENNFATGIWFDISSLNTRITNNISRNNEGIGIQLELAHKATVAGNVVHNNSAGIMLADTSGAYVYNNRLINNRHNEQIILKDSPRLNKNRAEIALGITWITRNNVVTNNHLN